MHVTVERTNQQLEIRLVMYVQIMQTVQRWPLSASLGFILVVRVVQSVKLIHLKASLAMCHAKLVPQTVFALPRITHVILDFTWKTETV